MDFNAVATIVRQELVINIRNRWTTIFALVFGGLALAISYFGMLTAGAIGFQSNEKLVGEKVQNVFEYLEGNYPRLRLYLNSPAAQALAAAENAFPIIKGSPEKDGAPLMKPVAIHLPLEKSLQTAPAQTLLTLLSLSIAGTAIAAMWRGRLR